MMMNAVSAVARIGAAIIAAVGPVAGPRLGASFTVRLRPRRHGTEQRRCDCGDDDEVAHRSNSSSGWLIHPHGLTSSGLHRFRAAARERPDRLLKRYDFSSNRHHALAHCLSMSFSED